MTDRHQELIGSSEPSIRFAAQLRLAAKGGTTILLAGESGTGKGLAARALHALSPRSAGPLVIADLAAIAPTLIEGTLFGHERGAFTDAHIARRGLFRRAEGGTLVLDDIDLLPLEVQAKLLRVLQEREVEPLGAEAPVPIDVRVVATTNRELAAEVEAGAFRADLYYRIAVVTLEVPPLRSRIGDLAELVEHLTRKTAARLRLAPRALSEAAARKLREHAWPGNVRELENAIERVLVLGNGDGGAGPIGADELSFLDEAKGGVSVDIAGLALRHGLTLDELTHALLERALVEERGNVSAAARRVGLTRRAFDYRMARTAAEESTAAESKRGS